MTSSPLDQDRIQMEASLHDLAKQLVLHRGGLLSDADKEHLMHEAVTAAARLGASPYDPATNPADAIAEQRYQAELKREAALEQQRAHATAALREQERDLAQITGATKPEFPVVAAIISIIAVGVSLTLPLHDVVFVHLFNGPIAPFLFAWVFGTVLAAPPLWMVFDAALHPEEKRSWEGHIGFIIGLGYGLGVYLLRKSGVTADAGEYLAVGFAAVECMVMIAAKVYAMSLHRRVRDAHQHVLARESAAARVEAARVHRADRDAEFKACEAKIAAHHAHVQDRTNRHHQQPLIIDAARAAVRAGIVDGESALNSHINDGPLHLDAARARRA